MAILIDIIELKTLLEDDRIAYREQADKYQQRQNYSQACLALGKALAIGDILKKLERLISSKQ